jgi:hypothetical protein
MLTSAVGTSLTIKKLDCCGSMSSYEFGFGTGRLGYFEADGHPKRFS